MKLEKQLIKSAFNGHRPITVIPMSLNVIFLPKYRSLTLELLNPNPVNPLDPNFFSTKIIKTT